MPLTPTEAADVARRHGLSLQDAAGLLSMAVDADEADTIAARFAAPEVEEAGRRWAAELFGRPEPKAPAEPPTPNAVPREGSNPEAHPAPDAEMRALTARLFDRDPA
jgi:hypothetical protein